MTSRVQGAVKGYVNFVTASNMTGYWTFSAKNKIALEDGIIEHKAWFSWLPVNSVRKNTEAPLH
jgi:hypothetical protein